MSPVDATVNQILDDIKEQGLAKALEYTALYDHVELSPETVFWNISQEAPARLPNAQKSAIDFAIAQIRHFHESTKPRSLSVSKGGDLSLSERMVPLDRVGIYVPNGQYPLISSLFMTAIPAQVAGVTDLVVAIAPKKSQENNAAWLYALQSLGIGRVLRLGGAQAIAAMGYGFEGLPPVQLIAGPGNAYVAAAKQELLRRGVAGLDVMAGPSEVLVIASQGAPPDIVALDLLAQAEHAADAHAYCVCWEPGLLEQVQGAVARLQAETSARVGPIEWIAVDSPGQAVAFANRSAPEHLGLMGAEAEALSPQIRTAGALFVGWMAGQALGDYVAGPSHVLPTGGTGRFLSGLSTRTFMRKMSVIEAGNGLSSEYLASGQILAALEGLHFHEQSLRQREELRTQNSGARR